MASVFSACRIFLLHPVNLFKYSSYLMATPKDFRPDSATIGQAADPPAESSLAAPTVALVLPCYNEEPMLPETVRQLSLLMQDLKSHGWIALSSFVLFVDDGSDDGTWRIIESTHAADAQFRGLKLAGNSGHQNALMAGMLAVHELADCAITLDADLQDDISVIPEMLERFRNGDHVVYGVRQDRQSDTRFKRCTANTFYRIMGWIGVKMIAGHGDFRLASRLALESLADFPEQNLFLRTVFPAMNLRHSVVYYSRKKREFGETKYPFRKMVSFALRGVVMSSPAPLRLAGLLGMVMFFLALLQSALSVYAYCTGNVMPGWTSLILATLYLGAIQLFCLAVIGEYLAKVFTEVKRRPRFIVEKILK